MRCWEAGRHSELVPELDAAIAAAPFRERLRGQLMLALYRSGRQADALRAYARCPTRAGRRAGARTQHRSAPAGDRDPRPRSVARGPADHRRGRGPGRRRRRAAGGRPCGRADQPPAFADDVRRSRRPTWPGWREPSPNTASSPSSAPAAAARRDSRPSSPPVTSTSTGTVCGSSPSTPSVPTRPSSRRWPDALGLSSADVAAPLASPPIGDDDRIRGFLADRTALVILDNCEHVIDGAARLAVDLLESAPELRLLATSREALRVPGEAVWVVPPLDTDDAVTLFADRARAATSAFDPTDAERSALADLCTRLDGMPLAIELTAARSNAFTVTQLSERIDDRFRLLTGGARTALPRQQTLRAVTDWSYDLLFDHERRVFERLSVFAGGLHAGGRRVGVRRRSALARRRRLDRRPVGRQVAPRDRRIRAVPAAANARPVRPRAARRPRRQRSGARPSRRVLPGPRRAVVGRLAPGRRPAADVVDDASHRRARQPAGGPDLVDRPRRSEHGAVARRITGVLLVVHRSDCGRARLAGAGARLPG